MKTRFLVITALFVCLLLGGCAWTQKVRPPSSDPLITILIF